MAVPLKAVHSFSRQLSVLCMTIPVKTCADISFSLLKYFRSLITFPFRVQFLETLNLFNRDIWHGQKLGKYSQWQITIYCWLKMFLSKIFLLSLWTIKWGWGGGELTKKTESNRFFSAGIRLFATRFSKPINFSLWNKRGREELNSFLACSRAKKTIWKQK